MTNDQVVAGLIEVHGLVTGDEEFTVGIHEAVDENAVVLEQVISKLANLGQQMAAMVTTADVDTGDVGNVKAYTEQEDARLDKQLRISKARRRSTWASWPLSRASWRRCRWVAPL